MVVLRLPSSVGISDFLLYIMIPTTKPTFPFPCVTTATPQAQHWSLSCCCKRCGGAGTSSFCQSHHPYTSNSLSSRTDGRKLYKGNSNRRTWGRDSLGLRDLRRTWTGQETTVDERGEAPTEEERAPWEADLGRTRTHCQPSAKQLSLETASGSLPFFSVVHRWEHLRRNKPAAPRQPSWSWRCWGGCVLPAQPALWFLEITSL